MQADLYGRLYSGPRIPFLSPGSIATSFQIALHPEESRAHHKNNFQYLGRLHDRATVAQAQTQVDVVNARVLDRLPHFKDLLVNAGFRTNVSDFQSWLMRHVRPSLKVLWAGALLVLLIGTVNLAGLSIARSSARVREMATRLALGSLQGAASAAPFLLVVARRLGPTVSDGNVFAGTAWGWPGNDWRRIRATRFQSRVASTAAEIRPAAPVFAYARLCAMLTGIFAGLASLIPFHNFELASAIRDGGRDGTARSSKLPVAG